MSAGAHAEDRPSLDPVSVLLSGSEYGLETTVSTQDSVSEQQPGSNSDSSLESPPGVSSSDVPQIIPCVLVFSLAFQMYTDARGTLNSSPVERSKKLNTQEKANAKARRYYHIEYFLLPDDEEPRKVDMVVFPTVTKVFMDSGVKTVRPWLEGDKIWVTWTQNFNIQVTKEFLKKINVHKINMKIWDTKDKVSRKVRYYRLKTSGYTEDLSAFEVRYLVVHQRRLSEQITYDREDWNQDFIAGRTGRARRGKSSHEPENLSMIPEEIEKLMRTEGSSPEMRWSSRRTITSLGGNLTLELKELLERSSFDSIANTTEKLRINLAKQGDLVIKRKVSKRMKKLSQDEESEIKLMTSFAHDVFVIELSLTPLLAGWKVVLSRGSGKSPNILDCFLTLKTDRPIMSEQQRQELNPMTIKISRVSCLPTQPVAPWELEGLCVPVYCKYRFPDMPTHVTEGHPHSTCVHFQDVNVIFLGDMHPGDLREFLGGPPLEVEVHDRDRKSENTTQRPALFGEDPLDTHPNLHAFVSPRESESNPFESQNKMWDPYGVARVSFADLLLGHTYLNLNVPVHNCEPQPTNPNLNKRRKQALDGIKPMPMGNYVDAHTQLKMRVDIAAPLLQAGPQTPELDPTGPPFGRVIFVFEAGQHVLLQPLLRDVIAINGRALNLDTYPLSNVAQTLPAIKVHVNVDNQQDLDVITGFHLLDGQSHLLVLEGLAALGLKHLWENFQSRIPFVEQSLCAPYKVLYNSQLLFRRRLYMNLESVVYHVHLSQPLAQLMSRPEMYLRDTVPRPVFQALSRIYDICHQNTRLREVITRDLLPSAVMLKALSQHFGLPISQEFLEREGGVAASLPRLSHPEPAQLPRISLAQDIAEHQAHYLQWRHSSAQQSQQQRRSFIQNNILSAYQAGKKPVKCVGKVVRIAAPAGGAVFNYSSQALNSSRLARKELQQEMAREPRKRFTYCQKYLSAMVDCYDPEEERAAERASRQAWLTAEGFQVTGLQKTGYLFPRQLGTAFTEEWQEGALFRNVLDNVLDRDRWPWDRRRQDFELYKKPPPFLPLPPVPQRKPAPGRKLKGSR